jgi:hypothetical protein
VAIAPNRALTVGSFSSAARASIKRLQAAVFGVVRALIVPSPAAGRSRRDWAVAAIPIAAKRSST